MQVKPILYSYRRCPYAMRARMALRYADIDLEIREISLREKPRSMLILSPKGTVPVLKLVDGGVIDQSLDIMSWALSQSDPNGWSTQSKHEQMNYLIHINDEYFKKILDQYKYSERHQIPIEEILKQALAIELIPLNTLLQKNNYLMGDQITLADIAIFPFIRQFSMVDIDWWDASNLNELKIWLNRFIQSDLFTSIMTKHPIWFD